jgi:hypothetical protein
MDRSEVNPFCASHKAPFIPMSEVRGFTALSGNRVDASGLNGDIHVATTINQRGAANQQIWLHRGLQSQGLMIFMTNQFGR